MDSVFHRGSIEEKQNKSQKYFCHTSEKSTKAHCLYVIFLRDRNLVEITKMQFPFSFFCSLTKRFKFFVAYHQ